MNKFISAKSHLIKISEDDFHGLLSNNELSRMHTDIGADLKHATTIIALSDSNEPVRIDSRVNNDKMRRSCVKFREYCGECVCFKADRNHAERLLGLTINDILRAGKEGNIQGYEINDCVIQLDGIDTHKYYFAYICPYLGHVEYMFPILFNETVIAVMFVGQFRTQREGSIEAFLRKRIHEDKDYFLGHRYEKTIDLYEKCGNNINKLNSKIISDIIQSEKGDYKIFVEQKVDISNQDELNALLTHIIELLYECEGVLVKKHHENMKLLIDDFFSTKKKHIFSRMKQLFTSGSNGDKLEKFWELLSEETRTIFEELNIGTAYIYGNKSYVDAASSTSSTKLSFIFSAGELLDAHTSLLLTPNALQDNYPLIYDNSYEEIKYSNNISVPYISFLWPAYNKACSVIMQLIHSPEANDIDLNNRNMIYENILNLYSNLFSNLQSLWSLISEDKVIAQKKVTEDALSIFSHEINQHTAALSRLYLNNLTSVSIIRDLPDDKLDRIGDDFFSSVQMLDYIAKNSKVYLGIIKPSPTSFRAFAEKIFKFSKVFREDAKEKNIYLQTPLINRFDELRSELYTDKVLFEQILFNLLRNAFQYSHPNTNILIDCKKDSLAKNLPHKLTITNYGIQLDKTVDIYDMHIRGNNANDYFQKGTGIGLFVVRLISLALKGSVSDSTKKWSDYNIPLIEPYLELINQDGEFDHFGIEPILRDILKDRNIPFNKIINSREKQFGRSFILDRIKQGTWETTFTVTIPRMEG